MLGQIGLATLVVAEVSMTVYSLNRFGVFDKLKSKIKNVPKATKAGVKGFKEGYGSYIEAELL